MIQKLLSLQRKLTPGAKPTPGQTSSSTANQDKQLTAKQALARHSELFARSYLKHLGWTIKETNWRAGRSCEIDIIAIDPGVKSAFMPGDTPEKMLVFVEVKARRRKAEELGFAQLGFESIDYRKRKRIMSGALLYLAKHHISQSGCRFDAIILYYPDGQAVGCARQLNKPEIHHVKGIF
jgi:Holliday junction resolvase-like predicted endonuclease